jgi:hypothetical protein
MALCGALRLFFNPFTDTQMNPIDATKVPIMDLLAAQQRKIHELREKQDEIVRQFTLNGELVPTKGLMDWPKLLAVYTERLQTVSADQASHLRWMLDEIPKFNEDFKRHRWLGFLQGACWVLRLFTIDEMREHVMKHKL